MFQKAYEPVEYKRVYLKIATSVAGESPNLLVFIHGLGCARAGFDGVFNMPALQTKFKILTLDLPGFGESDKPDNFSYSLQAHAAIVIRLIKKLDAHHVTIVGHSMGGVIGMLAAKALDTALLINCEGNLVASDAGLVSRHNASMAEAQFLAHGFKTFVGQLEHSADKAFQTWAAWCRQASPVAFYRSAKSLVEWSDSGELLGLYQSLGRKAYIHGDHGEISEVTSSLSKEEVFSIPHSGHFMMIDNPNELYGTIAQIAMDGAKK